VIAKFSKGLSWGIVLGIFVIMTGFTILASGAASMVGVYFMKKKWIITGVIVIILVLFGLNIWKSEKSTKVAVKTASLKEASMQETIMTPGVLKMNDEQYVYYQEYKGEIDEIVILASE